jgi:hypothetical protein
VTAPNKVNCAEAFTRSAISQQLSRAHFRGDATRCSWRLAKRVSRFGRKTGRDSLCWFFCT